MLLMLLMIETAMMKSESLLQVANALEETWLPWCKRPSSTACRMPTNERMNRIESNLCVGVRNRFLGKIDEEQYCKTNPWRLVRRRLVGSSVIHRAQDQNEMAHGAR
jgi:hypothetical protein